MDRKDSLWPVTILYLGVLFIGGWFISENRGDYSGNKFADVGVVHNWTLGYYLGMLITAVLDRWRFASFANFFA